MTEPEPTPFQRKLAERRAAEAAKTAASASSLAVQVDEDLIPDEEYTRSDSDREMDRIIDSIKVLDAYSRWCGKMTPKVFRGQTENIMISCPIPGHTDKIPSAWLNTDKNAWFCGTCQQGGDSHDLAAYRYGYDVPGYKVGATFHKLRTQMATDFGYTITRLPGGAVVINAPYDDDDETESDSSTAVENPVDNPAAPVVAVAAPASDSIAAVPATIDPEEDEEPERALAPVVEIFDESEEIIFPKLNWRPIVPAGTFLDEYMKATIVDDVAEEFHFFNGLIALGFACGKRARLFDMVPVHANLFICTLGHSGSGKSKSKYHLDSLLSAALPLDRDDPNSRGVKKIGSPGSAEVLIWNFQKEFLLDPSLPKTSPSFHVPVSGLVEFNELSALMGRTNRTGSVLKPTLMSFYDMEKVISTSSMGTGEKEAHDPFCSAITSTQPLALKSLLGRTDDDSGFLNRWVFVAGPEKKHFSVGGVRVDMTPAVAPLQEVLAWSGSFGDTDFIQWSPEALDVFDLFFHSVLEPAKKAAQSALVTRIDLLMKKLILLFSANKLEGLVSPQTVKDAMACYNYLMACYGIPEAQIGNSAYQEVADAIMYQAKKQYDKDKKGVTLSAIARALTRHKFDGDVILRAADTLIKLGFLEIQNPKLGAVGRPTVRYRYVV